MLRALFSASRLISRPLLTLSINSAKYVAPKEVASRITYKNFTSFASPTGTTSTLLSDPRLLRIALNIPSRNVTKYSIRKGKRKSVRAIRKRFYRLNWGGWIRTKCGRQKRLWMKSPPRKRRLRQHVLVNATQSALLDKMAGAYWRKPKYYVDDPYEPYHTREEHPFTYRKPRPYFPPEK